MKQGTCKYKDERKNRPNVMISYIDFGDFINVEEWDVNENYHSLQPFEEDKQSAIKYCQEEIKQLKSNLTGDKEKDKYFKDLIKENQDLINDYNKYKNKRFRFNKEEFDSTFEILNPPPRRKNKSIFKVLTKLSDEDFIKYAESHNYKDIEIIVSKYYEDSKERLITYSYNSYF